MYRNYPSAVYNVCFCCKLVEMKLKKITKLKLLLGGGVLVIAPLMMAIVSKLSGHQTTCIFDALGFKCLGCNMLGAFYKLKQGRFVEAFYQNPLIYVWLGIGFTLLVSELYTGVRRLMDPSYKRDSAL